MESVTKSRWIITSTNTRPGSPDPEMFLITSKDKVKINEAAGKLLNIQGGEYLMFIVDGENEQYYVAKGTKEFNAAGEVMMGVDKRTGKECERFKGAKMSAVTGKAGFGILLGSDANNWRPLRAIANCPAEQIAVFSIGKEATTFEATELGLHENAGDVTLYPINFARLEDKIEREAKEDDEVETEG